MASMPQAGGIGGMGGAQSGRPPLDDPSGQAGLAPASKDEQAQYEQFVKNGMELIYTDGHVAPAVLAHLQGQFDDLNGIITAPADDAPAPGAAGAAPPQPSDGDMDEGPAAPQPSDQDADETMLPEPGAAAPAPPAPPAPAAAAPAPDAAQPAPGPAGDPLAPNPVTNLAVATVGVVLAVETSAMHHGVHLEDDVVFNAGIELLEQLAEVAEAGKLHDYTQDELDAAANKAAAIYGASSKRVDRHQALDEFAQFIQAHGGPTTAGVDQAAGNAPGGAQAPAQ